MTHSAWLGHIYKNSAIQLDRHRSNTIFMYFKGRNENVKKIARWHINEIPYIKCHGIGI